MLLPSIYWFSVQVCRLLEDQLALVTLLSKMTQLDTKYPSYDLSKPQELLSYFTQVGRCLACDQEELNQESSFLHSVDSSIIRLPSFRQRLRKELESIHEVMQSNSSVHPLNAAQVVQQALKSFQESMEHAVRDARTKAQKEDAEVVLEGWRHAKGRHLGYPISMLE